MGHRGDKGFEPLFCKPCPGVQPGSKPFEIVLLTVAVDVDVKTFLGRVVAELARRVVVVPNHLTLPCFECYKAGFEEPNPDASG